MTQLHLDTDKIIFMLFHAHLSVRKAKTESAKMAYLIFHSCNKTLWLHLETSPLVLRSSRKNLHTSDDMFDSHLHCMTPHRCSCSGFGCSQNNFKVHAATTTTTTTYCV